MPVDEMPPDPSKLVELTGEETRCLLGLKNYYVKSEEKPESEAIKLAWEDLKAERDRKTGELAFPRLQNFTWFR